MKQSMIARCLAMIIGGLSAPALASGTVDLSMIERGKITHNVDIGGRFEFPMGAMIYQAEADDQYSKGYRPTSSRYLEGNLTREIYDLPEQVRSRGTFVKVRDSLSESGFEVIYECARRQCGEPEAWALYLTPLMRGASDDQYYVAAKAGEASFVSVYAKEIGGQTRILVDHVLIDETERGVSAKRVASFRFASSSSALPETARRQLGTLMEEVETSAENERFVIEGHADQTGSLLRNLILSGARAKALRNALIEHYGANPDRFQLAAYGSSKPEASGDAQASRRVNVVSWFQRADVLNDGKASAALHD